MNKHRTMIILTLLVCTGLTLASCAGREILSRNGDKIQEILELGKIPGMQIALVTKGKLTGSEVFGKGLETDSVMMNGSVQKTFDAAVVLQLAEAGLIDLEDDINQYLDFPVRNPGFPDRPITFQMLLSHRSGLEDLNYQFSWDTECAFYPDFRKICNPDLVDLPLEEFLFESFSTDGINFDSGAWVFPPGEKYLYSVSAYPLLRYLVEQVSGQPYPAYMQENLFQPLGMEQTGFSVAEFPDDHSIPHTRVDGVNIELQPWTGSGYQMHTTAEDMAKFLVALIDGGKYQESQILKPESIQLMTTRITPGSESSEHGYGLGLTHFLKGWYGHGGSTVGYQAVFMFNPSRRSGLVLITNINGILGGREDFESVWFSVAAVRDMLLVQLHPLIKFELFPHGFLILMILIGMVGIIRSIVQKKKGRQESKSTLEN